MNRESSLAYQEYLGARFSVRFLVQSYRILLVLLCLLATTQIALTIMWMGTCTEIRGLSLNGRVFDTHSFTCPLPGVEPLYVNRAAQK